MERPRIQKYKLYFLHPFIYEDKHHKNMIQCLLNHDSQWQIKWYQKGRAADKLRTEYFLPHIVKFLYPSMYLDKGVDANLNRSDIQWLTELSGLDFVLRPEALKRYQSFEVSANNLCYPLSFESIHLKIFHGGIGFLYFQLISQKPEIELNDLIYINQLIRPLVALYEGFEVPKVQLAYDQSITTMKDIIDQLLHDIRIYKNHETIFNIYIDRLLFYTYACVQKSSLLSKQWIYKRTDMLEALRSCSLFVPNRESILVQDKCHEEKLYYSKYKSSVYGFSKEGGVLLAVDRDHEGNLIEPNFHNAYIPQYFSTYYLDIFILGLYQRISLINYCRKLSMLKSLMNNKHEIEHIRFQILKFTNTAWFTQITNAELGMNIWEKWLNIFENETLYCEVKQGLDELDDFLENKKQSRFNAKLGIITALTIPPTLIFSYVGNRFEQLSLINLLNPRFIFSSLLLFSIMMGIFFLIERFYDNSSK
ncbi:MAG: hypothetical protein ACOYVK_12845 [Bacillota bacterium]